MVAEYSGNGLQTTRPFTVDGPWEVQWSSDEFIQIFLSNADQEEAFPNIIANQIASGSGSAYQPRGGSYYLKVNAAGNWRIKVVAIKNPGTGGGGSGGHTLDEKMPGTGPGAAAPSEQAEAPQSTPPSSPQIATPQQQAAAPSGAPACNWPGCRVTPLRPPSHKSPHLCSKRRLRSRRLSPRSHRSLRLKRTRMRRYRQLKHRPTATRSPQRRSRLEFPLIKRSLSKSAGGTNTWAVRPTESVARFMTWRRDRSQVTGSNSTSGAGCMCFAGLRTRPKQRLSPCEKVTALHAKAR